MDERARKTPGTGRRRTAWLLLAAVLSAFVGFPGRARAEENSRAQAERQFVTSVLTSLSAAKGPTPELAAAKLIDRGPAVVPALRQAGDRFREPDHVNVIVTVLRKLDRKSLDAYLLGFVAAPPEDEERGFTTAYGHLGDYGGPDVVPALIGTMDKDPYWAKRPVENALTRLLVRHDGFATYDQVDRALAKASGETRARVACCIGNTDSPDGLLLLARLAGRWSDVDHSIVAAIAQMPEAGLGEQVVPSLRRMLESDNMNVRRETVTALAVFADVDSAKTLIEYLGDEERGLRGNAHWALKQLSGLHFPETKERWEVWFKEEVAWWEAEGSGLLEVLRSGTDLQILQAIQWLSEHRLYRTKFSVRLRKLLDHPSEEVRAAAEAALVRLGLTEDRKKADPKATLAARGFHAVTPEEVAKARVTSAAGGDAERSGPSRFVPIAGLLVLMLLFFRIFGPSLLHAMKKTWKGKSKQDGPIVLNLKTKRQESAD